MSAGRYDLLIEQGATFQKQLTWKSSVDGTPYDLTNYSARAKIKKQIGGAALVSLTESNGITLGGTTGQITLTIHGTQTAALDFNSALWDLEVQSPGTVITRLLKGGVRLSKEITV